MVVQWLKKNKKNKKNPPANAGDVGSIPGLRRHPGKEMATRLWGPKISDMTWQLNSS